MLLPMNTKKIMTPYGEKSLSVYNGNILDLPETVDVLTASAFYRSYYPVPGTVFEALNSIGIPVHTLAAQPEMDLRTLCNVWLSAQIPGNPGSIRRIGCVETDRHSSHTASDHGLMHSIRAYFQMLDIAATYDIPVETVALPLLGGGRQEIRPDLVSIPLIRECTEFLKRNPRAKRILFADYNPQNAIALSTALENSYSLQDRPSSSASSVPADCSTEKMTFISYSSPDRNIADNLCSKLEANGMKVWYAPRNISTNDYASGIAAAITSCSHFVVIISKNSMLSQHVLNEIDLAFRELNRGIRFLPLRLDEEELAPAFTYYLSRQHWMDAHIPPLEKRLEEFTQKILST